MYRKLAFFVRDGALWLCCLFFLACTEKDRPAGPGVSRDVVALSLEGIVASDAGAYFAVLQTAAGQSFQLPLELCPASAVDLLLDGVHFPRPLTHDLMLAAADSLGSGIEDIVLSLEAETVPAASIVLLGEGDSILLATPGDAIALHYASAVPLWATPELIAHLTAVELVSKTALAPISIAASPRRARLLQIDTTPVEMSVLGLVQSAANLAVVLLDPTLSRAFPVFIGFCQASSIAATLHNEEGSPVRSQQLFVDLLKEKSARIEFVRITELRGETYIGELVLSAGNRSFALDARPSDAIALALRTGAPVQLVQFLLDEWGEDAAPYRALFAEGSGKWIYR